MVLSNYELSNNDDNDENNKTTFGASTAEYRQGCNY